MMEPICFVPCQVTFASLHKVKFYLDFSSGLNSESVSNMEIEAANTVSKLNSSFLTRKGIIQNVTYDINRADEIIYFDIYLSLSTTQTSFIELLSYLNSCL